MKPIGITLIIIGIVGIIVGYIIFGAIGIVCAITSLISLFSGIGFLVVNNEIEDWYEDDE